MKDGDGWRNATEKRGSVIPLVPGKADLQAGQKGGVHKPGQHPAGFIRADTALHQHTQMTVLQSHLTTQLETEIARKCMGSVAVGITDLIRCTL